MVKVLTCSTPYYSCGNFIVVTMQEILVISATDFFDVASRRHNDIILLPAIRRVSGNDFVFQQGSAPAQRAEHVQQLSVGVKKRQTFLRPTCGLQIAEISVLWITRSGLSCSIVSTTDKSIVWMNWNGGSVIDVWCSLELTFDEAIDHWQGRHLACVHAKGGHFEFSLWTDNLDFVHICYIQCDLFDCYVFNYEIMPATLSNTFLFTLQDNALPDLRYGGRFYGRFCRS